MNAEVEVNEVPFAVTEPDFDVFDAAGGGAAVRGRAMHVRLAGESLAHGLCVAA